MVEPISILLGSFLAGAARGAAEESISRRRKADAAVTQGFVDTLTQLVAGGIDPSTIPSMVKQGKELGLSDRVEQGSILVEEMRNVPGMAESREAFEAFVKARVPESPQVSGIPEGGRPAFPTERLPSPLVQAERQEEFVREFPVAATRVLGPQAVAAQATDVATEAARRTLPFIEEEAETGIDLLNQQIDTAKVQMLVARQKLDSALDPDEIKQFTRDHNAARLELTRASAAQARAIASASKPKAEMKLVSDALTDIDESFKGAELEKIIKAVAAGGTARKNAPALLRQQNERRLRALATIRQFRPDMYPHVAASVLQAAQVITPNNKLVVPLSEAIATDPGNLATYGGFVPGMAQLLNEATGMQESAAAGTVGATAAEQILQRQAPTAAPTETPLPSPEALAAPIAPVQRAPRTGPSQATPEQIQQFQQQQQPDLTEDEIQEMRDLIELERQTAQEQQGRAAREVAVQTILEEFEAGRISMIRAILRLRRAGLSEQEALDALNQERETNADRPRTRP